MTSEQTFEGGCLCGALRWRADGEPLYAYHCHCQMPRHERYPPELTSQDPDLTD